MDVIFWVIVAIASVIFLVSPIIVNTIYEMEGEPKVVRTSTIAVSFLSAVSLLVFWVSVGVLNHWCGQITKGSSTFYGWYYPEGTRLFEKPFFGGTGALPGDVDITGCFSPLWKTSDNLMVVAIMAGCFTLLVFFFQFKRFSSKTNLVVGLYLSLSMLVLSLVYVLTGLAILNGIFKLLTSSSSPKP